MGERLLCKQEAVGSIPSGSTNQESESQRRAVGKGITAQRAYRLQVMTGFSFELRMRSAKLKAVAL